MWGIRVIIPPRLHPRVLKELHQGHMGVVKTKAIARSYIWWPGMDKEIKLTAKSCPGWQLTQREPCTVAVYPREWLLLLWQRIHIDFAGLFLHVLGGIECTFKMARGRENEFCHFREDHWNPTNVICRYGVPAQLVDDNGSQLKSEEFEQFRKRKGMRHITSAPYHPATNGLAERCVESFKNGMKSDTEVKSFKIKLATFLLACKKRSTLNRGRATIPVVFGNKTTHSAGPVKTKTQH